MKPERLYRSECLTMNYNLDKAEMLERQIIEKISSYQIFKRVEIKK